MALGIYAASSDCTVIVLTLDEEPNLRHLLESVCDWVSAVYIVDSGSNDKTVEIAREYTEHVFFHKFTTQADQFNWSLDNLPVNTEWILRLDADEFVMPGLRAEILSLLPQLPPTVTGLYMKRRVYFMGRWIRHGGYYPTWLLRLFRRGIARSEQADMDEHIVLLGGEARHLKCDFVDCNHKDLASWTCKHELFASREVRSLIRRNAKCQSGDMQAQLFGEQPGRKRWLKSNVYERSPLFLRAFAYFGYRYIFRLGFLDGVEGLIFHFLQGFWYRFYVDSKIWEGRYLTKQANRDELAHSR